MQHSVTIGPVPQRAATGPGSNPGTVGADDIRRLAQLTDGVKRRIRSLLELRPGHFVLDVGCGPGLDTAVVAQHISPTGRVAGIDYDASMIRRARTAGAHGADQRRVWYQVADATRIPYRTGTFDSCYCERVLQHTADAAAVVREMARVTKPGGTIVAADTDWGTLSIDAPDPALERAFVRFVGDTLHNGFAGRQLRRLMKTAGLNAVGIEMWPIVWTDYKVFRATSLSLLDMDRRAVDAGAVSAAALKRLDRALTDADRRGVFFASAAIVMARGRNGTRRYHTGSNGE
jgi:SAM-dependent methyltransferase